MTEIPFLGLPDLEGLDHADLAAAALACATRLSPLFAGLATRSDPRGYADLLADMWQLVGQGARDLPERAVNDLDYCLAACPEAFCDSSYLLDYEACSVLGVGYAALQVLTTAGRKPPWSAERRRWSCWAAWARSSTTRRRGWSQRPRSSARSWRRLARAGARRWAHPWPHRPLKRSVRPYPSSSPGVVRARRSTWRARPGPASSPADSPSRALVGPISVLGCPVAGGRHSAHLAAAPVLVEVGCVFDGEVETVPLGAPTNRFGAAPRARALQAGSPAQAIQDAAERGLEVVTAWYPARGPRAGASHDRGRAGGARSSDQRRGLPLKRPLNAPGRDDRARVERALTAAEEVAVAVRQGLGAPYCTLGSEAPSPTPGEYALSTKEETRLRDADTLSSKAAGPGLWGAYLGRANGSERPTPGRRRPDVLQHPGEHRPVAPHGTRV